MKKKTMNILTSLIIVGFAVAVLSCETAQDQTKIDLSGDWLVALDSLDQGERERWQESFPEAQSIPLPGTLDLAGIGTKSTLKPALENKVLSHLNRKTQYIGKAWYQRTVDIPEAWMDQALVLTLERVLWASKVWVNGDLVGNGESLVAKHTFSLADGLQAGKNVITICIDNGNIYPGINVNGNKYEEPSSLEMAHGYTNHTQIKWNGILGEISLKPAPKIKNLSIAPDIANRQLLVSAGLIGESSASEVQFEIYKEGKLVQEGILSINGTSGLANAPIALDTAIALWDEFDPNVYQLDLIFQDSRVSDFFGLREVGSQNGKLTLNGKRIYLRGTLECAVFPLTGFPPTDTESWEEIIGVAKAFGLNHFRFHSWCPPKAAFEAADNLGFYLQAELPHWNLDVGADPDTRRFLESEAEKMLELYGNHPSFILMALGNELEGDFGYLNGFVDRLKEKDGRRLYATTSFSFQKNVGTLPQPSDDFFVTQWTDKGWIRGQGIFNDLRPHFDKNYQNEIGHIKVPIISHEIGQYAVYPDLAEIKAYKGVLEPLNFIAVKNDLERKRLLKLAPQFTQASGNLAALLYKEEIERALKTPGFDGFQLLQLQDFPGQGTALVGLLNAFWESKGIIDAAAFSSFNREVVPLINMPKAVYAAGEAYKADIQVANFFKDLTNQTIRWTIRDGDALLASGKFEGIQVPLGNENFVGQIDTPLDVENAKKLEVTVEIENTAYTNSWSIWVYPDSPTPAGEAKYTRSYKQALQWLAEGQSVLLNPRLEQLVGVEGRFVPVFWSPVHFPDQPSTMGVLCDPDHPSLKAFPTDFHSDWQWWDLCKSSKALDLDGLEVEPIVRVIDNFVTNRALTTVFEAKMGEGKLLFTSIDLDTDLQEWLVAKQMRLSLESYMNSSEFNPSKEISGEGFKKFLVE